MQRSPIRSPTKTRDRDAIVRPSPWTAAFLGVMAVGSGGWCVWRGLAGLLAGYQTFEETNDYGQVISSVTYTGPVAAFYSLAWIGLGVGWTTAFLLALRYNDQDTVDESLPERLRPYLLVSILLIFGCALCLWLPALTGWLNGSVNAS